MRKYYFVTMQKFKLKRLKLNFHKLKLSTELNIVDNFQKSKIHAWTNESRSEFLGVIHEERQGFSELKLGAIKQSNQTQ